VMEKESVWLTQMDKEIVRVKLEMFANYKTSLL
jgi:hypothetical protein